jgi:xanthine dehydrogenase YagS FAD-binding subunit
MLTFEYARAESAAGAIAGATRAKDARYLGGGTNLVDLMRENIEQPRTVIDVTALSRDIAEQNDGSVLIGGAAKNTALAEHRLIRTRYPMLARAILAGASAQIRNMATVGGNLLQRTRCYYFYDDAARCNKRVPGAGCDAIHGFNRIHAILGTSPACIATHPSDMCVALTALDAIVHVEGPDGARRIPFGEFHRLPSDQPEIDTMLKPAELITAIELPPAPSHSTYRKVRDRASYAFALVSVAALLEIEDGRVGQIRLALGGVAHKPWRASKAEAALLGGPATEAAFRAAAEAELADARPLRDNGFKIELAKRTIVAVLQELAA